MFFRGVKKSFRKKVGVAEWKKVFVGIKNILFGMKEEVADTPTRVSGRKNVFGYRKEALRELKEDFVRRKEVLSEPKKTFVEMLKLPKGR